jgi:putative membrane protein
MRYNKQGTMKLIPHLAAAGLVGALVLSTAAVAQAASPTRAMPAHSSFAPSHAGSSTDTLASISRQDRVFLMNAHQGNLAEIKLGQLASQKGRCEAVRRIARVFIKDHSRLGTEVRSLADRIDVRLPKAPGAAAQKQLAEVAKLSGRKFDIAWLRLQVAWHREAIELGEQELQHGRSPEVKALASGAAPVIMRHLKLIDEAMEHC